MTFEYERLICFSKAAEVEGEWHIVFKETEAENLYEMNHARAMLHKKAYQHRVVMIIDRMWAWVERFLNSECFLHWNDVGNEDKNNDDSMKYLLRCY